MDFSNYEYDSNGNKIKETLTTTYNNSIHNINYFTYDNQGNLLRELYYQVESNGELFMLKDHTYTYDSEGDLTKYVDTFYAEGYTTHVSVYSY
jgi:antitoxin component YwqK of YwqJK toxin-antitoxin module